MQVQKLQNQQAANTGLLPCITTNMQNTDNISATQYAQLSTSVSGHLDNITKVLNTNFGCIDKDLKQSFYNQNLICNTMETCHVALA